MTYRPEDHPYDAEDEAYAVDDDEPEKRGLLSWILITALLVGTGSGSALAWRGFGGSPVPPGTSLSLAAADRPITQADLDVVQKQLANSEKLLTAQQTEIKRLAD